MTKETIVNEHKRIADILERYRNVAVVGVSRDSKKDSYRVTKYLQSKGFEITPINPFSDQILNKKCYKSLLELPEALQEKIEVVDVFRPSSDVPSIVEQAIQLRNKYGTPHVIWMQLGISNPRASERAVKAGFRVIMNKCMMREHRRIS